MNNQRHKSIRPNPGVKRIQNYLFKFSDFLGKGNFSSVYKGINQLTKQTVAIKYIALDSLTCERLKELLDQQIEVLTSLNHPNIVKCFEVLKSAHNCYIVTQLCDGGDLQGYLKKKRILTEEEMIPFVRDIFQGLYYLSKKNIIHRDIKLANIFLNKGRAKIADFGFAQRAKKQFNDGKIGTPLCMSPQGFLQNLYGCKTDVWAFGVILYQLSHGRLPLEHCTTEEMLKQNIQVQIKMEELKPELSKELKELILRCLDVNPCTRLTFQEMRSHPFISKITGQRSQSMSLRDLRYLPTLQTHQSQQAQRKRIISMRTLDNLQSDPFGDKQNLPQKNYGTNQIFEGLKPQNTIQKFEKQERLNVRPGKINIPTVTYIPLKSEDKENKCIGEQNPVILQSPFQENEDYEIKVSHKSYTTLPNENINPFIQNHDKEQHSIKSTTDRDFLEVPSTPTSTTFRRKGSCEISENQQKLISKMSYETENNRPVTSRQVFETTTDLSKRQKIPTGIEICPLTNTKRLLNGFMKFNEAIGLIHFCRLIYKYIAELKSTGIYHEGDLNLRYYSNYLLNLMNELINKISSDHIILTKISYDQQNKDNKLIKMKKVIEEYIERYRPNLQKQRGEYLNRTTGQIKQIAQLDQKFIETFFIPDKKKLETYNQKLVKFSEILEKCSRYQKYSDFDSNKELEQSTKQEKKQKTLFTERSQNIQHNNKQKIAQTQTMYNKNDTLQKRTSAQLQENLAALKINPRMMGFQ